MRSFCTSFWLFCFLSLSAGKGDTISIADLNRGVLGQTWTLYHIYPHGYSADYLCVTKFHFHKIPFTGTALYRDEYYKRTMTMNIVHGKLVHYEDKDFKGRLLYKFDSLDRGNLLAVDSSFSPGRPDLWSASKVFREGAEWRYFREYHYSGDNGIENRKFTPRKRLTRTGWDIKTIQDGPQWNFGQNGRTVTWYRNGKTVGEDSTFYPNGTLWIVASHEELEPGAIYYENFPNGRLKIKGSYAENGRTGWWYFYNDSLAQYPSRKIHYFNTGYAIEAATEDTVIDYYSDGKIKSISCSDYYKEYDASNRKKKRKKDGEWIQHGTSITYFPDGKIASIQRDSQDTLYARWYENGQIASVSLKGEIRREWYPDGKMKSERILREGKLEIKEWDEAGNLKNTSH